MSFFKGGSENKYSSGVRIGNWLEDLCREVELKQNLTKTEKQSQKDKLLQPVTLFSSSFEIKYGDIVQIGLPGLRPTTSSKVADEVLTLSFDIPEALKNCDPYDSSTVTLGFSPSPVTRNCFMILSVKEVAMSLITYGNEFYLKTVGFGDYYLGAIPARSGQAEEVADNSLSLGLISTKSTDLKQYCRWRAEPHSNNPSIHGFPVLVNKQLNIVHCFTNRYLTGLQNTVATSFGAELEVRVKPVKTKGPQDMDQRINWILCMKSLYDQ